MNCLWTQVPLFLLPIHCNNRRGESPLLFIMAFSTETELKDNVKVIENGFTSTEITAIFGSREAISKTIIKQDLANCIDFTKVKEINQSPKTPDFINLLSQYKTAELTYVRLGSVKRKFNEIDDRMFWENMYNKLFEDIKGGKIELIDSNGKSVGTGITKFDHTSKKDVKPRFGFRKYGIFADDEKLEEIRNRETEEDFI